MASDLEFKLLQAENALMKTKVEILALHMRYFAACTYLAFSAVKNEDPKGLDQQMSDISGTLEKLSNFVDGLKSDDE